MTARSGDRKRGAIVLMVVALGFLAWALNYTADNAGSGAGATRHYASAAPADRTETADAAYVASLRASTADYGGRSDTDLSRLGHNVCTALREGNSSGSVGLALAASAGLELSAAGYLEGAAVAAYCPQYIGSLTS